LFRVNIYNLGLYSLIAVFVRRILLVNTKRVCLDFTNGPVENCWPAH